jgi:hypothetical protein
MLRLKYIVLTALAMVLVFGAPCFAIWLIETYNLQRTMLGLAWRKRPEAPEGSGLREHREAPPPARGDEAQPRRRVDAEEGTQSQGEAMSDDLEQYLDAHARLTKDWPVLAHDPIPPVGDTVGISHARPGSSGRTGCKR